MPIDIKEIFKSDLDPNSSAWFSSKKVDKLNYNFNQLSEGGNPGPLGEKGADGDYGQKGQKGDLGNQGYQGVEGIKGEIGDSTWIYVDGQDNRTVFPQQPPQNQSYSPQSVKIGFDSSLNEYSESISSSGPVLSVYADSGQSSSRSNIGFYSEGNYISNLYVAQGSSVNQLIAKEDVDGKKEWYINEIDFRDPSSNSAFKVVTDSLRFLVPTEFNSSAVQHNDSVKLTSGGPDDTKILVAVDNTGLVQWQKKATVFGSLPFGSIVAVNSVEWNSTNFEQTGTVDIGESPNQTELHNIFGRGKGQFEGWYICNGETWTNGSPAVSFEVPNLVSFDYTIDANGDNTQEPIANGGDNNPILVAGIDVSMSSTYDSNDGEYDSTLTSDDTDDSIEIDGTYPPPSIRTVNNTLWIVNLDNANLFWINNTVQSGPTTTEIIVTTSSTSGGACSPSTDPQAEENMSYYLAPWDANTDDWTDTSMNMSGVYLYEDSGATIVAAAQWYEFGGVARYWNGSTNFTQWSECPTIINVVRYDTVQEHNGDSSVVNANSISVGITTSSFATTASMLAQVGTTPAGWYRENGVSNGARRYWDGSQFIGHVFTEDYVEWIGIYGYNASSGSGICTATSTPVYNTFIANNTSTASSHGTLYNEGLFQYTGQTIYTAALFGTLVPVGEEAIYKSKDASSSTTNYNTLIGDDPNSSGATNYSTINSNSQMTFQGGCPTVDNVLYDALGNQTGDLVYNLSSNASGTLATFSFEHNNLIGIGGGPGINIFSTIPSFSGGNQCIIGQGSSVNWTCTIYDSNGNQVESISRSNPNTTSFTINASFDHGTALPLGTYTVDVTYYTLCCASQPEMTIELVQP